MDESERLETMLLKYSDYLQQHTVLNRYWQQITLVLKGSTARGYSDQYSDLDFVLFTDKETCDEIVSAYVREGLSSRTDGIFLPLGDWDGHYHLDTYEHLRAYFDTDDVMNIWEYTHIRLLHDPFHRYQGILEEKNEQFKSRLDSYIRGQYLTIQLQLDWMRQPLRRADAGASLLYGAAVWRACCRLLYLLCDRAYPGDTWLFFYMDELPVPESIKSKIKAYGDFFHELSHLKADKNLEEYPLYAQGTDMVSHLCGLLHDRYGNAQWIDEWYLYA